MTDGLYAKQKINPAGFSLDLGLSGSSTALLMYLSFDPLARKKNDTQSILKNISVKGTSNGANPINFAVGYGKGEGLGGAHFTGRSLDALAAVSRDKRSLLGITATPPTNFVTVGVGSAFSQQILSDVETQFTFDPNIIYRWSDDFDGDNFPVLFLTFGRTGADVITNITVDLKYNEFRT